MSLQPPTTLPPEIRRESSALALDPAKVRDDFLILRQKIHGKPLVYLDNAATSQKPQVVIDALRHYYECDNANVHRGNHLLSQRATDAYEAARIKVQKFIGASCLRSIIFTRGCTEAINLVASTFGRKYVRFGDEVLVTWMEHHSNIVPWQILCEEKGAHLRVVPVTDRGELDLEEYERLLSPRTRIVAVTHVSNALGTINPVKKMIASAHKLGIPVLIDGAQAVPHLRVDVRDLDCDFYAFSGHKMYGPTGIGALYGKPEHLELMPPYQGGGDMIRSVSFEKTTWNELPYKFEAGTPNIADAVALAAAIDYIEEIGRSAIAAHEQDLLRYATEQLQAIPGVRLIGTAPDKAAVLSFVVEDPPLSALDVGTRLDLEGVAVRTGHHCCEPLMSRFGVPGTVRASLAFYNTFEEIDVFIAALRQVLAEARGRPRSSISVPLPALTQPGSPMLTQPGERGGVSAPSLPLPNGTPASEPIYPSAVAASPEEAAQELADVFDFLGDWTERYHYLIELGQKLLPLPAEYRTEANRVKGCQSTVYLHARKKPGTRNTLEFLAVSDADIVCGLIALLQHLFSGQPADKVVAFDIQGFFKRIGLDQHLTTGRRNGLADMVGRLRNFAAEIAEN